MTECTANLDCHPPQFQSALSTVCSVQLVPERPAALHSSFLYFSHCNVSTEKGCPSSVNNVGCVKFSANAILSMEDQYYMHRVHKW